MPKYLGHRSTTTLVKDLLKLFVRKDGNKVLSDNNFSNAYKEKLDGIAAGANKYELPVASASTLGGVKIGTGIIIDENGAIHVPAAPEVQLEWDAINHKPTTLEGYGITDAATKADIEELEQKVSTLFKFKGSVATKAALEAIENPNVGDVYNVEEDEADYAWDGEKWDSLGARIDLSLYWAKDELVELTDEEVDILVGIVNSPEAFMQILADSDTAVLNDDLAVAQQLVIDKDFTLDLGGWTLSFTTDTNEAPLFRVTNGTLTIKGAGNITAAKSIAIAENGGKIVIESGNLTAGDVAVRSLGEGSKVTMNGGSITAVEGGIGAFDKGEIEMNGGSITVSDNFGLFTNGTANRGGNVITMNGGEIIGNITSANYEAIGVYIANSDTFTMNGGRIVGNGGAGILMRGGTITINDGEIIGQASENRPAGSTGYIGDKKKKMSQSGIIYDEASDYPGKAGMNLLINGGNIVGVAHSLEVLSNEAEPAVVITGGDFTPAYPEE